LLSALGLSDWDPLDTVFSSFVAKRISGARARYFNDPMPVALVEQLGFELQRVSILDVSIAKFTDENLAVVTAFTELNLKNDLGGTKDSFPYSEYTNPWRSDARKRSRRVRRLCFCTHSSLFSGS
jgi:hypothetical protein